MADRRHTPARRSSGRRNRNLRQACSRRTRPSDQLILDHHAAFVSSLVVAQIGDWSGEDHSELVEGPWPALPAPALEWAPRSVPRRSWPAAALSQGNTADLRPMLSLCSSFPLIVLGSRGNRLPAIQPDLEGGGQPPLHAGAARPIQTVSSVLHHLLSTLRAQRAEPRKPSAVIASCPHETRSRVRHDLLRRHRALCQA